MSERMFLLDPIQRLRALVDSSTSIEHSFFRSFCPLSSLSLGPVTSLPSNQLFKQLLLLCRALHELAQAVQLLLGHEKHAYLLGDSSVLELLRESREAESFINDSGLPARLETLATIGLIHRFPVARKFGYDVPGLVQIRLSGWGEYLIEQTPQADLHHSVRRRVQELLQKSTSDYQLLLALCNGAQRPLPVQQIHEINARLQLPLVT